MTSKTVLAASKEDTDQTISQLRKKVKTLTKRSSRQQKKITQLGELLAELKSKRLLEQEPADVISKCFDSTVLELVQNELGNKDRKKEGRRYSDTVKQFALTIFYYSPQAYEYCRTVLSLPHVSSIRSWLSNIDADPGFLTNVIELAARSGVSDYTLVIDSMAIRKQTSYENGKFTGFCDYGGCIAEDADSIASEALAILLIPLTGGSIQYPIAYFFVNKVNAKVQSELIRTAMVLTAEKGLTVRAITCDGCAANISTLGLLGININPEKSCPGEHPIFKSKLYGTLDACHMLKLARNALGDMGSFVTAEGQVISWQYIRSLYELQDEIGLHIANRLTRKCILYNTLTLLAYSLTNFV